MAAGAHAFVHKKVNYGIKYFLNLFFIFFLWQPYSMELVSGGQPALSGHLAIRVTA